MKLDKNSTIDEKLGIYKEQCKHCLKEFQNKSGLASHQLWCKAAITAKQKREIEEPIEIKSSHDTTVFVANVTKNVMPTCTDGWRKRMHASHADDRNRSDLERSSIMYADMVEDDNTEKDQNIDDVEIPIDVVGANAKIDGHKGNHASSKCHQWTVREKLDFVDDVMQAIDDELADLANSYFCDVK